MPKRCLLFTYIGTRLHTTFSTLNIFCHLRFWSRYDQCFTKFHVFQHNWAHRWYTPLLQPKKLEKITRISKILTAKYFRQSFLFDMIAYNNPIETCSYYITHFTYAHTYTRMQALKLNPLISHTHTHICITDYTPINFVNEIHIFLRNFSSFVDDKKFIVEMEKRTKTFFVHLIWSHLCAKLFFFLYLFQQFCFLVFSLFFND